MISACRRLMARNAATLPADNLYYHYRRPVLLRPVGRTVLRAIRWPLRDLVSETPSIKQNDFMPRPRLLRLSELSSAASSFVGEFSSAFSFVHNVSYFPLVPYRSFSILSLIFYVFIFWYLLFVLLFLFLYPFVSSLSF